MLTKTEIALGQRDKAIRQRDSLVKALELVRDIIKDGALTGFNCHDGDWTERLFASQAMTYDALRFAKEKLQ